MAEEKKNKEAKAAEEKKVENISSPSPENSSNSFISIEDMEKVIEDKMKKVKKIDLSGWRAVAATLAIVLTCGLLASGAAGYLDSVRKDGYNMGFKAGQEVGLKTAKLAYENTPWYSRYWNAIKGTFPE